jgi:F-type H+-transporting ATPase subunit b
MFLSLDGTFWVQLVNFAIFFVILNVVFLRPVQKAIANRRAYIDSLTTDYEKAQSQAAELRRSAEEIRAQARREGDVYLAHARAEAGNRAAEITTEYNAQAQKIVEDAHATVAEELEAIRPHNETLARDLANSIVGKVIPEAVH